MYIDIHIMLQATREAHADLSPLSEYLVQGKQHSFSTLGLLEIAEDMMSFCDESTDNLERVPLFLILAHTLFVICKARTIKSVVERIRTAGTLTSAILLDDSAKYSSEFLTFLSSLCQKLEALEKGSREVGTASFKAPLIH